MEKILPALLGCVLILYGIQVFLDPIYYDSKHGVTMDFTGINHPFGIFVIIVGCLFLWTTFRKKGGKNRNNKGDPQ